MKLAATNMSCGIYQLSGIGSAFFSSDRESDSILKFVKEALASKGVMYANGYGEAHARPCLILFSDTYNSENASVGARFAKWLTEKGYGDVYETPTVLNPSVLKNKIKLWSWHLDEKVYETLGLKKLYTDGWR